MGILKRLFGFRKNEIKVEEKIETEKNNKTVSKEEIICEHCHMPIWGEQKIKTFQNKKYHVKPCWRDLQKIAKRDLFK